MEQLTITIEEAARALGVTRNSAYQAAHAGELPVVKIGRRLLVPKAALNRLLEGSGQKPNDFEAA